MRKNIVAMLALAALSAPASATGSFDGVNAQLGAGVLGLFSNITLFWHPDLSNNAGQTGQENQKYGDSNLSGLVSLGYSYGFENKLNLAANIFTHFGFHNSGGFTQPPLVNSEDFKLKSIRGLSIEPGYYLCPETVGYLKLGWAQSKGKGSLHYTDSYHWYYGHARGNIYGLGLKHKLSEHLFLAAESYRIHFKEKYAIDPQNFLSKNHQSMIYGGFSVGYIF